MNQQLDRILGTWYGQMAGDALGSQVEFKNADFLTATYPQGLRTMGASMVWGTLAGQVTDDTELAIALGYSLIDTASRGYNADRAARRYRAWYDSGPFDMGYTIGRAVSAIPRREEEEGDEGLARAARSHADKKSQANGALMRHSILAIWGASQSTADLEAVVRADTVLTHPHIVCQDSSVVFAVTVARAIAGEINSPQDAYQFALQYARNNHLQDSVTAVLEAASQTPPPWSKEHTGWVLLALHNAFYQLLHAPNLEDGIISSVMLGGDTDTNAAIAGALLGSIYGFNVLPPSWFDVLSGCRPQAAPGCMRPRDPIYWPANAREFLKKLNVLPQDQAEI